MKCKILMLNLFLLVPTIGFSEQASKSFETDKIKKLDVVNGSGKVTIVATKDKKSTVRADKIKTSESCQIVMEQMGDILLVKSESSKGDCEVNFNIAAPSIASIDAKIGSGGLDVSNMQGAIDFKTGSGNVVINNSSKKIVGKVGSGEITVNGMISEGDLSTGSGDIKINFPEKPEKGKLEIKTGSGSAVIGLPSGSIVETSLKTGSGSIHNEIGDSKNSNFKIFMKSGSGGITLKKK